MQLSAEIRVRGSGLPPVLRTVEQSVDFIDRLPPELARLPRWTFARALLVEVARSGKSRDMKAAVRQLKQALSNEHWLDQAS
jgi:hypothetical protein